MTKVKKFYNLDHKDEDWTEEEVEAYPVPNAENIYTGTFMVQDLAPASVYMARVSSHNLYGYSEPGQVFQFATRGGGKCHTRTHVYINLCMYQGILKGEVSLYR